MRPLLLNMFVLLIWLCLAGSAHQPVQLLQHPAAVSEGYDEVRGRLHRLLRVSSSAAWHTQPRGHRSSQGRRDG
jgi:hypothetical protein